MLHAIRKRRKSWWWRKRRRSNNGGGFIENWPLLIIHVHVSPPSQRPHQAAVAFGCCPGIQNGSAGSTAAAAAAAAATDATGQQQRRRRQLATGDCLESGHTRPLETLERRPTGGPSRRRRQRRRRTFALPPLGRRNCQQ